MIPDYVMLYILLIIIVVPVARRLGYIGERVALLLGTPMVLFIPFFLVLATLCVIEGFLTRRLKREKVILFSVGRISYFVVWLMLLPLTVAWVANVLGYVDDRVVLLAGIPVWLAGLFCFLSFIVHRLRRWLWVMRARRWAATGRPDNLRGAELRGRNLSGVDLGASKEGGKGANLAGANLLYSNLTSANLSAANLAGANLGASNLTSANLSAANLHGANLLSANLQGAKWSDDTRWPEGFTPPPEAVNVDAEGNAH